MESSPNPVLGLLSLWMLIQLVIVLALLGAGLYTLFCLSRASRSLERLAEAAERLLAQHPERLSPGARPAPAPTVLPNPVRTPAPVVPAQTSSEQAVGSAQPPVAVAPRWGEEG